MKTTDNPTRTEVFTYTVVIIFAIIGLIWVGWWAYHAIHDPYEAEHVRIREEIHDMRRRLDCLESWKNSREWSDSIIVTIPEGTLDDHYIGDSR